MSYPLTADGGPDDLPRTLRREKEAREREAREREAAERAAAAREALPMGGPSPVHAAPATSDLYVMPEAAYADDATAPIAARVVRFDVPFGHLMMFFLKAVLAAIPAMILLGAVLWGAGQLVKALFPWLIKAQILIHFPN
ncbi:MAG: hypothetical protein AB7E80_02420 [Hyphomicrobiaceae bacterium]